MKSGQHRGRSLLYSELAKLHEGGFAVDASIEAVLDTSPPPWTVGVLENARAGLAEGKSIAEAFGGGGPGQGSALSELETSILRAAERGGKLGTGFKLLAGYFDMREKAARAIRKRMFYPLVLLHFGVLIPVVPLMIGAEDPWRVLAVSLAALFAVYLIIFGALVVGRRMAQKARRDPATDRKLACLPLIGAVRQNLALSRFSSVLHMHVLAGEDFGEGLRSAAAASGSGRIVESVDRRIAPAVAEGNPIGPEIAAEPGIYTAAFGRGFITAEKAGSLDEELERWARRFTSESSSSMDKLGTHGPKAFYALVVLVVLWQIFRLVSKIFGHYNNAFKMLE